ncbi:MAG: hypothetical protein K1X64_19325 [Myxococcaceae bacterium]|nr:hypothetical protein [Myxococcaceae bacterium]
MGRKKTAAPHAESSGSSLINQAFAKVMHEIERLEKAMAGGKHGPGWNGKGHKRGGAR